MTFDHSRVPHLHGTGTVAPRVCPFAAKHGYCPPQKGDSRSVCPALNTMANHGYLPRKGENITLLDLVGALHNCYGLTYFLSAFLALGGFFLLRWRPWCTFRLEEIGKHGAVEHDASLVHEDARGRHYAPTRIHPDLLDQLEAEAMDGDENKKTDGASEGALWTPFHAARARVRQEKGSPPLDAVHAEIARGEIAIMFCVWDYMGGHSARSSSTMSREHHETELSTYSSEGIEGAIDIPSLKQPARPEHALGLPPSASLAGKEFSSNAAAPLAGLPQSSSLHQNIFSGHTREASDSSIGNAHIGSAFSSRQSSVEPEPAGDHVGAASSVEATPSIVGGPTSRRVLVHRQACDEPRGMPLSWWLTFLAEERLPEGMQGYGMKQGVGILEVVKKSAEIKAGMEYIRRRGACA
ncbi:hypothetical protein BD626DRAFT_472311 [Schizophyllum amplum]|uniref:Heme haloperoxidase family profile domain-containing protein n=1 Tax=Schizophyllum amplum TaxID=97359 RepID=A0A550CVT0_9AGAR|nr:hypothetical protein BD626DRAFT_472311 [Auriculariopsis ampla]